MRKNPKHRKFINSLPCATCNETPPSECSHIRRRTDGGTGLKPSDMYTIPQCRSCHSNVDYIITIDNCDSFLCLANALLRISGDWGKGVKLVLNFRSAI